MSDGRRTMQVRADNSGTSAFARAERRIIWHARNPKWRPYINTRSPISVTSILTRWQDKISALARRNPPKGPTAYDVKPVHKRFKHFSDDELKQLRILPLSSRLEQGATYIDLHHLHLGEFKATGDLEVGRNAWLVAKKDTPYELWNRLLGIEIPERSQRPE
jgi:hypothetical protein